MGSFLTPPGGPTEIRSPRPDEGADTLGNFAGNDPGMFGKIVQLITKLRQPIGTAMLSLGVGGGAQAGVPIMPPPTSPTLQKAGPAGIARLGSDFTNGMLQDYRDKVPRSWPPGESPQSGQRSQMLGPHFMVDGIPTWHPGEGWTGAPLQTPGRARSDLNLASTMANQNKTKGEEIFNRIVDSGIPFASIDSRANQTLATDFGRYVDYLRARSLGKLLGNEPGLIETGHQQFGHLTPIERWAKLNEQYPDAPGQALAWILSNMRGEHGADQISALMAKADKGLVPGYGLSSVLNNPWENRFGQSLFELVKLRSGVPRAQMKPPFDEGQYRFYLPDRAGRTLKPYANEHEAVHSDVDASTARTIGNIWDAKERLGPMWRQEVRF